MAKKKKRDKRIPLSPETVKGLKAQRQRFIDKFGREPGPDDPIFFDPSADTPQPINKEVVDQHLLEGMHRAGVPREIIYAYQKTGRLVTEQNRKYLTKAELKEWMDAVDEWRRPH